MTYKGYDIEIEQDDCSYNNPRGWDKLGTMVCWHRRYALGDENPKIDPSEYRLSLLDDKTVQKVEAMNYRGEYEKAHSLTEKMLEQQYIMLPLYLYEHSGITMSTGSFSCPWDSGQVGFIYVSKEDALKEYTWKRITSARYARIVEHLRGEVHTYDQYISGDLWLFDVPGIDGNGGIFGYDNALAEAKSCIDWYLERKKEQRREELSNEEISSGQLLLLYNETNT